MRIIAGMCTVAAILGLGATGAAAEDAWIRVEAKRGAAAEATLAKWQARFPDAVAFPLVTGMTAIALGPQSPAEAAARMAELKAAGTIPRDSFLTGPGGTKPLSGLTEALTAETPPAGAEDATEAAGETAAEAPSPASAGQQDASAVAAEDAGIAAEGPAAQPAEVPQAHVQLQATPGRVSAGEALENWRRSFPEAQLYRIPGGWYAVALPAQPQAEAQARLDSLKAEGRIPRDAFLTPASDMGSLIESMEAGADEDLPTEGGAAAATPTPPVTPPQESAAASLATPALPTPAAEEQAPAADTAASTPAPPAVMPPDEEVQRVLRWAGRYDGAIDGKAGPATRAAIDAEIEATGGTASPAEAVVALVAAREDWRAAMGLATLTDAATGLSLMAPVGSLAFDRTERALSIYGPKDGSGAALILFSQPGGQQELSDLAGLVTALGWVPSPVRDMGRGRFILDGANELHIGHAEGRLQDGIAEGWVLIWPAQDVETARRLIAEAQDSFTRAAPPAAPGLSPTPPPAGASGPDSTRSGAEAAPAR